MTLDFDGLGTLAITSGSDALVSGTASTGQYEFSALETAVAQLSHTGGAGTDEIKARNYLAIGTEEVDLVAGQTSASFSNGIVLEFGAIAVNGAGEATNLTSLFAAVDGTFDVEVTSKDGKDFVVQTGANQGDELSINIDNMNAKTLGVAHSKIADRASGSNAITETNNAINKVSTQRAALGALQNRLSHKISNLDTSAENLQAAESRIRDVDMAKEMTNFTKNNILSQASTAMLAQANSLPQGVLQLLG